MDSGLHAITASLAKITDQQLGALIDAANSVPKTVRGTSAWIRAACEWELNRRQNVTYELQLPDAAIASGVNVIGIGAAFAVRTMYILETRSAPGNVLAFFDALKDLLTGGLKRRP